MTNQIIGAVLSGLLLYLATTSPVHRHAVQGSPHEEECAACLWQACGIMEVPPETNVPVAISVRILLVPVQDVPSGQAVVFGFHSRAPPLFT
jgi:hypothetical protein